MSDLMPDSNEVVIAQKTPVNKRPEEVVYWRYYNALHDLMADAVSGGNPAIFLNAWAHMGPQILYVYEPDTVRDVLRWIYRNTLALIEPEPEQLELCD